MPLSFLKLPKSSGEIYLGLFLKEDSGTALVLEEKSGELVILEKEKFNYSNGWENLIEDVDEVLLRLEKQTSKSLDKTIIFVYSHFVDEKTGEIKKPYLAIIKNLFKNLELKPLGYIECYQGVLTYLEEKEASPLTAILIELDKTNFGVFVYKLGQRIFAQSQARTDNLIDDLTEVFGRLKGSLLPSRIILYNSSDLDSRSTEILAHRWSPQMFVNLPRVEIVKEDSLLIKMVGIFYEQISQGKTITKEKETEKEVMGFMINSDIARQQPAEEKALLKKKAWSFKLNIDLKSFISKIKLPGFKMVGGKNIVLIAAGLIIVLSMILTEVYIHKAGLTVFLPTKSVEKKVSLDELELPVATISADFNKTSPVTGKRDIGEKAKGEVTLYNFENSEKTLAKGTALKVKSLEFVLDAETKVGSASNVTLSDGNQARLPGKVKAKATASELGPEGNITKGQKLQVGDLDIDNYYAINETAFSGGTKKEIKTVSKTDIENLQDAVLVDAKKELTLKIKKDLKPNQKLFESLTEYDFKAVNFTKEVGEETADLGVKVKISASYYLYDNREMLVLIKNSLSKEIPDGYSIDEEKITYNITKAKKTGEMIILEIEVKTKAMKTVSQEEMIAAVAGKKTDQLDKIVKTEFGALEYKVEIKPSWPLINSFLPLIKKNINLIFSSL